jgi:hypothetical protein
MKYFKIQNFLRASVTIQVETEHPIAGDRSQSKHRYRLGISSVVEYLLGMYKALGLIPNPTHTRKVYIYICI